VVLTRAQQQQMAEQQAALNQQILLALQAITQQLQAQNEVIAAANPIAVPAVGAPVFAETPAKLNADAIIDYSTTSGIKLYNTASARLPITFDITSQTANLFCDALKDRANKSGWYTGAGNILTIPDAGGTNRDLITEYGRLSMADINTHVATYIDGNTRCTQNAAQMLTCIKESLSDAGKLKILAESEKWKVNDKESGTLLFKYVMQKAIVDTRATSSFFRENLLSLDSYITTVDSNIELFNQYVNVNRAGLEARGEKTDDLVINLFKAYLNVADQNFVEYMKKKKDDYDEGTATLEPETLMTHALNKYHILVQERKWKSMSPQDEQLVALKAQYEQLRDANLRLAKSISGKKMTKSGGQNKAKPKGNKSKGTTQQKHDPWKKEPPKDGEPHTKVVNNKNYNWCPFHKAWTFHTPSDCHLGQVGNSQVNEKEKPKGGKKGRKTPKWLKTLAAICEDGFGEESLSNDDGDEETSTDSH
jgi:hypothetical protein